jgi:regulatory protein
LKGSRSDAKAYALKLLSYRSRSKKEMHEKLQKRGFDSRQINDAVKFLEDAGLINDAVLASDLLRYSMERKSLGKNGIRMFLARRGIDKELVEKTLLSHTKEKEERAALEFVERKVRTLKNCHGHVAKRRLWGMLQRRGFPFDVIKKTVDAVL